MYINYDKVPRFSGINSIKWDKIDKNAPDGTLPLWVADMDFPCAPSITASIKERTDTPVFGYTYFEDDGYISCVAGWYKDAFGWDMDKDAVFYSPGVVTALSVLVNILSERGDAVIIQRPVYPPFTKVVSGNGRVVLNNRLINDNESYSIDFDGLETLAREKRSKLLIMCSPHNPIGRVWKEDELLRVVEICQKNGIRIISDEIHCDITRQSVRHNMLEAVAPFYKNNIITCTAPSKTFNIAGLGISHIIINDSVIREKWTEFMSRFSLTEPNPLSLAASWAAFKSGRQWVYGVNDYIDGNMTFIDEYIKSNMPKVRFSKPEGTYLAWLDFNAYGKTCGFLFDRMLENGVMLQKGADFGKEEGEGFMRLNAACPRQTLNDGLDRILNSLK